jgi:hypothetical protein
MSATVLQWPTDELVRQFEPEAVEPFFSDSAIADNRKHFAALDAAIQPKVREYTQREAAATSAWADLLPLLDRMQSFLSQRGYMGSDERKAAACKANGLPTWSEYFAGLNLDVSLRAVQKRLREYRGLKPPTAASVLIGTYFAGNKLS